MDILPGKYSSADSASDQYIPQGSPVVIVGVDMPFGYMMRVILKWTLAAVLVGILLGFVVGVIGTAWGVWD